MRTIDKVRVPVRLRPTYHTNLVIIIEHVLHHVRVAVSRQVRIVVGKAFALQGNEEDDILPLSTPFIHFFYGIHILFYEAYRFYAGAINKNCCKDMNRKNAEDARNNSQSCFALAPRDF